MKIHLTKYICFMQILQFLTLLILSPICGSTDDAKRLHDTLLRKSNYNKLVRPRSNLTRVNQGGYSPHNDSLLVKTGIKLAQILEVDTRNEIITTNMFVVQEWHDYRLSWKPEEYGGIKVVHIPSESIWLPDLVLYNNGDGDYTVTIMTQATVNYKGLVLWEPPATFKSQCNITLDYFPFDEQHCHMKFGCWTYDGDFIDLTHINWDPETALETLIDPGMDLRVYCPSNEWDLMTAVARKKKIHYTCCPEPFIDITYNFTMRRRNSHFYTINILVPMVSINMITVLAFHLPAECHEKISLCISILLSLSLFRMMLMDFMPSTSLTVPLLAKYILFTCVIVTVSVFSSVIVLNVHFRSTLTHHMSYITRRIFVEILPKLLFMNRPDKKLQKLDRKDFKWSLHQSDLSNYENPYKTKFKPIHSEQNELQYHDFNTNSNNVFHETTFVGFDPASIDMTPFCEACAIKKKTMKYPPNAIKAMDGTSFIAQHLYEHDERRKLECEWKYVGQVVDRLLLWIYTSVCIVAATGILLNAPILYDDTIPLCDKLGLNNCSCRLDRTHTKINNG